MTTRPSPPQSNQSVIAFTEEIHWAEAPAGAAGGGDGERADGDPVRGLVQAAVGDRPLEDVVRLVTLLEESPQYADAAGHVLRAVALDRPVEEVARLVAELTRPPRAADSADDTIRAAVAHRCVEDVTRLVDLLHRAPQQPHCGREAVRAAAAGRPVEELVELIGRLTRQRDDGPNEAETEQTATEKEATEKEAAEKEATEKEAAEKEAAAHRTVGLEDHSAEPAAPDPGEASAQTPRQPDPGRDGDRSGRHVFWPSWLAAAALMVCGAAHFPLRREGASVLVYGVALAVSGLCGLLALVLALRAGVALLVAGAVVPAALAGIGYFEGRFASAELTRSLAITVAPPWSAGLTAVCASLASLAALSLLLMVQVAEKHPAPRPLE